LLILVGGERGRGGEEREKENLLEADSGPG